jgi:hypothetical protein
MPLMIPNAKDREQIMKEFFLEASQVDSEFFPEFLGFFVFEPYDEAYIRKYLIDSIGYESPPTHADCTIHEAAEFLFRQIHSNNPTDKEVAVMLRRGAISVEQALAIIAEKSDKPIPVESLRTLLLRLDMEQKELDRVVALSKLVRAFQRLAPKTLINSLSRRLFST